MPVGFEMGMARDLSTIAQAARDQGEYLAEFSDAVGGLTEAMINIGSYLSELVEIEKAKQELLGELVQEEETDESSVRSS